jgi:2-(3-amino-3-carboxypropyl)histidine synthase
MEEDRLESNLTHDVEQLVEENTSLRQPKKRFVGRRQVAENSRPSSGSSMIENDGAIQCTFVSPPSYRSIY